MRDRIDLTRPLTKASRDAATPEQILAKAREGNLRFRTGRRRERDWAADVLATSGGQFPVAVLLSCIDSRAPAEVIFDIALGAALNCRVAGNVLNADVLGSLEFATKVAGVKVVIVLGHSSCSAVKEAIAGVELGNLTQLLAKLRPAIAATAYAGERSASNAEFVDAVGRTNVALTVAAITAQSPVIAELVRAQAVQIVGAFYDVKTGAVEFR